MNKLLNAARNFLREEDGVTAIEYSLIAALIAVVIITAVANTGNQISNILNFIANTLGAAMGSGTP